MTENTKSTSIEKSCETFDADLGVNAPSNWSSLLHTALSAVLLAGDAIMDIYEKDFSIDYKEDNSPLTDADRSAHQRIVDTLSSTLIPVLSEESTAVPVDVRQSWGTMWLVDPLDGTKEFIKKNGDFTVNIALIQHGHPIMGVVYTPVHSDLFFGVRGWGAFRVTGRQNIEALLHSDMEASFCGTPLLVNRDYANGLRIVASASHLNRETSDFIDRLKQLGHAIEQVSRGSSLKLCMIAAGEADIYPRLAPTMEWDTAAAHAVVESAGGNVIVYDEALHAQFMERGIAALQDANSLKYNKENLLNPSFIVF